VQNSGTNNSIYKEKPRSLNELQKNLKIIFDPNISALTLHEITFHLLEEVGEVAEALSLLHQQPHEGITPRHFKNEREIRLLNVCEELADVFAWIISLLEKTNLMLKCALDYVDVSWHSKPSSDFIKDLLQPTSNIVDLVWHTYTKADKHEHMVCEECEQSPCNAEHPNHSENCGMLFGNSAVDFYDEILSISLFSNK